MLLGKMSESLPPALPLAPLSPPPCPICCLECNGRWQQMPLQLLLIAGLPTYLPEQEAMMSQPLSACSLLGVWWL